MKQALSIKVCPASDLPLKVCNEILSLCSRAFECDFAPFLESFKHPVHVLGILEGRLVSHALWITRWLQPAELPILRTAYIEAVATDQEFLHMGFASAVMLKIQRCIQEYDLAGLCTGVPQSYERLGWQRWYGPLFLRHAEELIATPDETGVMVLYLPGSPLLDSSCSLSIEWKPGEAW